MNFVVKIKITKKNESIIIVDAESKSDVLQHILETKIIDIDRCISLAIRKLYKSDIDENGNVYINKIIV